jgi:hypothetical protein
MPLPSSLDYVQPADVLDSQSSSDPLSPAAQSRGYDADVAGLVLDRLADGQTLAAICAAPGMPRAATVRAWAAHDVAGFRDRYQQALSLQADAWADDLVTIADGDADDADTTRDRLRIETRQFLMRVRGRATYDPPKQAATTDALDWLAVLQAAGLAAQPAQQAPQLVQGVVIEHDAQQASDGQQPEQPADAQP